MTEIYLYKCLTKRFRLLLIVLSCLGGGCFNSALAQQPSFNGSVLSLPVVVFGEQFYSVDLTLQAGTDPIEFTLSAGEEIFNPDTEHASTLTGITLLIPSLPVGSVEYWIELVLDSTNPISFLLYDAGVNPVDSAAVEVRATALELFESTVSTDIVQSRCILCHIEGGIARATGLHFQRSSSTSTLNNFATFETFVESREDARSYIMSKVSGEDHQGGIQLPSGGIGFNDLDSFLAILLDANESISTDSAEDFFGPVLLQSNAATLRRAAIMLAGRLPTAAEVAEVTAGDDSALRQVLRGLMQGEGFHQFLLDGANDRLLVRGAQLGNSILGGCVTCYPDYANLAVDLLLDDLANDGYSLGFLKSRTTHGLTESPLELVAHVVENDLPYSEILTANYMMLNPMTNFSVGGTAVFEDEDSPLKFEPGIMTGYYRQGSTTVLEEVPGIGARRVIDPGELDTDYPHAGVLNSLIFLKRYPTTATNRNRARARWTYLHFLDIDIERSAQRTTDPVALADTNNPTLNNENCTVCHATMDPVAGAFQNYGDLGHYRESWEGGDALDTFYKFPNNGSPTLYEQGDVWYRDMRSPGFFEEDAPDPANSLQWLAQQIVSEPGFALATVKFWWPSLMGEAVLRPPEVEADSTYIAHLTAYNEQQSTLKELAAQFSQSGMNLKDLLVELMMSPWFRADSVNEFSLSLPLRAAHDVSNLGSKSLLTPERLQRKTSAITGFNWKAYYDPSYQLTRTGLGDTYALYYGGIDSSGVTSRTTEMTPLMSTVAMSHALESACPIVFREFILQDGQRKLFSGIEESTTPINESSSTFTVSSIDEEEFQNFSISVEVEAGAKNINVGFLNHTCGYDQASESCLNYNTLRLDRIELSGIDSGYSQLIEADDLHTVTKEGCGWYAGSDYVISNSCSVDIPVEFPASGSYLLTARVSAQQGSTLAKFSLSLETKNNAYESSAIGALSIKQKLIELHEKMLGKTYEIDSIEIESSYQLFVDSWLERVAESGAGALQYNDAGESCDWNSDIDFFAGLGFGGEIHTVSDGYPNLGFNYDSIGPFLDLHRGDPYNTKQAWITVITYLMTHYNYLYE